MLTFEKIKYYYDNGLWDKYRVGQAVVLGKITAEQYQVITGEEYAA